MFVRQREKIQKVLWRLSPLDAAEREWVGVVPA